MSLTRSFSIEWTGSFFTPARFVWKLNDAQHEIAQLQDQLNAAEVRSKQSILAATNAKDQLGEEQAQLAKITADRDAINQQLAAVRMESQTLRETASASSATAAQQAARVSALEAKLKDLNAAAEEKDRMLSVDKEFLSHDRDIRDLIAARDFYIADIYDIAQNGKTAKPFGRICYADVVCFRLAAQPVFEEAASVGGARRVGGKARVAE